MVRCSSRWASSNLPSPLASSRSHSSERMALADSTGLSASPSAWPGRCSPRPCSAGSRRWWDRRSGSPPPRRRSSIVPACLHRRGRSPACPLHAETAAGDFGVVAAVLVVHQLPQLTADVEGLASNFTAALGIRSECPGRRCRCQATTSASRRSKSSASPSDAAYRSLR